MKISDLTPEQLRQLAEEKEAIKPIFESEEVKVYDTAQSVEIGKFKDPDAMAFTPEFDSQGLYVPTQTDAYINTGSFFKTRVYKASAKLLQVVIDPLALEGYDSGTLLLHDVNAYEFDLDTNGKIKGAPRRTIVSVQDFLRNFSLNLTETPQGLEMAVELHKKISLTKPEEVKQDFGFSI